MGIEQAISQILIDLSKQYPIPMLVIVGLFILRPFNKIASKTLNKRVEKSSRFWNTLIGKLLGLCKHKWYLRIILWVVDVVLSVKTPKKKVK